MVILESRYAAVQVVLIRALDLRGDDFADLQRTPAREVDRAVDLGRVGHEQNLINRRNL
jgi:hypothetical protein